MIIDFFVNLPVLFALTYFTWRVMDIRRSYLATLLWNAVWFVPTQIANGWVLFSENTVLIAVQSAIQLICILISVRIISRRKWAPSIGCGFVELIFILIASEAGRLMTLGLQALPVFSQMDPELEGDLFMLLRVLMQCALLFWGAEIICAFLKRHAANIRWSSFVAILAVQMIGCILMAILIYAIDSDRTLMAILLSGYVVLIVGADIHMLRMFRETVSSVELSQRLLMREQQMTLQQEQYSMIEDQIKELRQMRHDYSNTLETMRLLMAQGHTEQAEELADATGRRLMHSIGRYTGIPVVDAVLYRKLQQADQANVTMEMQFALPERIGIEDRDLLSIFANLLDNALEYCARLPASDERRIMVSATAQGPLLALRFSNTYKESQPPSLDEMHSTKPDAARHGLGLQIVRTAVQKYNGTLSASIEGGMLIFHILLNGGEKPEKAQTA